MYNIDYGLVCGFADVFTYNFLDYFLHNVDICFVSFDNCLFIH